MELIVCEQLWKFDMELLESSSEQLAAASSDSAIRWESLKKQHSIKKLIILFKCHLKILPFTPMGFVPLFKYLLIKTDKLST